MSRSLLALALLCLLISSAAAQAYQDLHDFGGTYTSGGKSYSYGSEPLGNVVVDSAGNLYGTASQGGLNGCGMVWEMTVGGNFVDLHDFGNTINGQILGDGRFPSGNLVVDASGNLYGTVSDGGPQNGGLLWEITSAGEFKDLHDFGGSTQNAAGQPVTDGQSPIGVTRDAAGNLYGTTSYGGANQNSSAGMLWELTSAGKYVDLHDFGGTVTDTTGKSTPDGTQPYGSVILDGQGNIYGAAQRGGPNGTANFGQGFGVIWKLPAGGQYVVLHAFGGTVVNSNGRSGSDGSDPRGAVVMDPAGNLYGATATGGANEYSNEFGSGMLWKLTPGGKYIDLHDFGGDILDSNGNVIADGSSPLGGVALDAMGNLYGAGYSGGKNFESGMIWQLETTGLYRDLHDFGGTATNANGTQGSDGSEPVGAITVTPYGVLLGTASQGGPFQDGGLAWVLSVSPDLASLSLSPGTVTGGDPCAAKVTLTSPALPGGTVVSLATGGGEIGVPETVTVPPGQSSLTFALKTLPVSQKTVASLSAFLGSSFRSVNLTVNPPALTSLTLQTVSSAGGWPIFATVTLTGPAPTGGARVGLSSSSPAVQVPSSALVAADAINVTIVFNTVPVANPVTVTLTASYASVTRTAVVKLSPPVPNGFSIYPFDVIGGQAMNGELYLNAGAPAGFKVQLTSSNSHVVAPASISIPVNQSAAGFSLTTLPVASRTVVTITASAPGGSTKTTVYLDPPTPSSLTLASTSVTGSQSVTGTVTLTGNAPVGGLAVALSSGNSAAKVPSTVTVPAGKNTATFTIKTTKVTSTQTASISATYAGITQSATLTITP